MFRLVTKQCAHHLRALVNKPVARSSRILKIVDLEQPGRGNAQELAVFDSESRRSFLSTKKVPSNFTIHNTPDKGSMSMAGNVYEFSDFAGADIKVDGGTIPMVMLNLVEVDYFLVDTPNGPVYPAVLIGAPELEKRGVVLDEANNKLIFPAELPLH